MKCRIRKSGKIGVTIPLPARIALRVLFSDCSYNELPRSELKNIFCSLKAAKKIWGHLTVLEIHSSDGYEVTLTL